MFQGESAIIHRHKIFIERVVALGEVWGLKSEEGFAVCPSNDYDDTDVLLFWSDKAYANAVAKDEWELYEPACIPLSHFLENWLVGMQQDGALVGSNFDANLFGQETEPLELTIELLDEIKRQQKVVELEKYNSLIDFEEQVRRAME
jgi:hypothetical protein